MQIFQAERQGELLQIRENGERNLKNTQSFYDSHRGNHRNRAIFAKRFDYINS